MINILLLMFAFVLFVIATFSLASPYWNRLISAGLACWVAAQLFVGRF